MPQSHVLSRLVVLTLLVSIAPIGAAAPVFATAPQDAGNSEFVSQIGGASGAIAVQDQYAYLAIGPQLAIVDIGDPGYPVRLGQTAVLAGIIYGIAVSGSYAYLAAGVSGLHIIDISDPSAPSETAVFPIGNNAISVTVAGDYVYLCGEGQGLHIVDVSDPAAPLEAGFINLNGGSYGVAVAGDYAYVAEGSLGMKIIDVSDPTTLVQVGGTDSPGNGLGIAVAGAYAYLADAYQGLRVIDVANPYAPFEAGHYDTPGYAQGVTLSGSYAYVADGAGGLRIVDVSAPPTPVEVGACDVPGAAWDVVQAGSHAYVADLDAGLRVVDVSAPTSPFEAGSYAVPPGQTFDVAVEGDYAYVAAYESGLRILDVSDPYSPLEVGFYDIPGRAIAVVVTGGYAYVAHGYEGLRIVDISDPAAPFEVGFHDSPGYARDVAVVGGVAYIADSLEGLRIVDVSTPGAPVYVGRYDVPSYTISVTVADGYAYVGNGTYGLRIIDVSDPGSPVEAAHYDTTGYVDGVAVAGDRAYVADSQAGLHILNVSDPSAPFLIHTWPTAGYCMDVVVDGAHLYVADRVDGVRRVNVSDPEMPFEDGFFDTPGDARRVAVVGAYVYIADYDGGLVIARFTDATYQVSGHVANAEGGLGGVEVAAKIGEQTITVTTTDAVGDYTLVGLPAGSYDLVPRYCGYIWTPAVRPITVPTADQFDFAGSVPDIGFRPNPDGFGFYNGPSVNGWGWGFYPAWPASEDFTLDHARRMWSDNCVCIMVGSFCIEREGAYEWRVSRNLTTWGGHCHGMAAASLRLFQGLDTHPGSATTFEMGMTDMVDSLWRGEHAATWARQDITFYQIQDSYGPVSAQIVEELGGTAGPNAILCQLAEAMASDPPNYPTLVIYPGVEETGHALAPYRIEDVGDGKLRVYVYDSNHPGEEGHAVEFDKADDTWSYDLDMQSGGGPVWTGCGRTHTVAYVPLDTFSKLAESDCPFVQVAIQEQATPTTAELWLVGGGHLLISDSHGRHLGFDGDQFVSEIPGAYVNPRTGGLGVNIEPGYTLPLTGTYTILLDGQTLTRTETVRVSQNRPGYMAWVHDIDLGPDSQDLISFANDGFQIDYQPGDARDVELALVYNGVGDSEMMRIGSADGAPGETLSLQVDQAEGQFAFGNPLVGAGSYDVEYAHSTAAGRRTFAHSAIPIDATDTHYFDYDTWDGTGPMTLHVDHGSDGTIDETLELANYAHRLYLPLLVRH